MTSEQQAVLSLIEWEYAEGQSFGVGEDDVLLWLFDHGWTIIPPAGYKRTRFEDFPSQQ